MKKNCLLINGAIRTTVQELKEVIENYKRLFQDVSDLDIWFYTWNDSPPAGNPGVAPPWNPPTADEIRAEIEPLVDHFVARNKSPTSEEVDTLGIPGFGSQQNHPHRVSCYASLVSVTDCFNLFEEEGFKYDVVARGRNDCVFSYSHQTAMADCIEMIKGNPALYLAPKNLWSLGHGVNDHFGIATHDLMKLAYSTGPSIESLRQEFVSAQNPEILLQNKITKNGGIVTEIPGSISSYYMINKGGNKQGKWVLT